MTAILFGSIGSLADTSELQREAFNVAFAEHGLDWSWSQDEYRSLLDESGGAKRIAAYARSRGEDVDADAVHATKSARFQARLRDGDAVSPRPGVVETITAAQRDGVAVALVTTTAPENVAALSQALRPAIDVDGFALVVDTSDVTEVKPAPDAYAFALRQIGETAEEVVAIEDNAGGVKAAAAAGLACVAFPGVNNAEHDYGTARARVDALDYDELRALAGGARS